MGALKSFLNANPNATMPELTKWAALVNEGSGRGKISSNTAHDLEIGIFAPRYTISRFRTPAQALVMLLGVSNTKEIDIATSKVKALEREGATTERLEIARADLAQAVGKVSKVGRTSKALRKQVAKAAVRAIVFQGVTLGLFAARAAFIAQFPGDDDETIVVGLDPEDSDFMRIVVDNTRLDVGGGFIQPWQLLGKMSMGVLPGGRIAEDEIDLLDPLVDFLLNRVSPSIGLVEGLITGEGFAEEEITRQQALMRAYTPLFVQDFAEAVEEEGLVFGTGAAAGAFFGARFTTIPDELKAADIKRASKHADYRARPPRYVPYHQFSRETVKEFEEVGVPVELNRFTKQELNRVFGELYAENLRRMGIDNLMNMESKAAAVLMKRVRDITVQGMEPFMKAISPQMSREDQRGVVRRLEEQVP